MKILGYIGYTVYCVVFLVVSGVGVLAATPVITIQVLVEKYRAMKQGKPVNWHIFKEGL